MCGREGVIVGEEMVEGRRGRREGGEVEGEGRKEGGDRI